MAQKLVQKLAWRKAFGVLPVFAILTAGTLLLTGCGKSGSKSGAISPSITSTTTAPAIPSTIQMAISVTDSSEGTPKVVTWNEVDSIDGSYRSTADDKSDDEAFDAPSRTLDSHLVGDGHSSLNVQANISLSPPDNGTRQGDAFAQYVSSLAASADPRVTNTTMLSRGAYRAQFDVTSSTLAFDHADVTVDAQTGLLLLADMTKAGKPYQRSEATTFNPNPDMTKVSFTIAPVAGDDVNKSDGGFTDTQVSLVKSQVGYDALAPQKLPAGFAISRVITHASLGDASGVAGGNPQSQGVVVQMFKGPGWQKLFVTSRQTGADPAKWSDPLADVANQFQGAIQPFIATAGALTGAKGETVVSPAEAPHVWVAGTTYVVTASGPFSTAALTDAVNSLGCPINLTDCPLQI